MNDIQCLSHTKWDCKFHVVWIPKCRRKMLYGQLRKNLGEVFHDLARQKESRIVEGHLQPDHVHMLLLIPPKYSVAHVVGYMKGKSAIYIASNYLGLKFGVSRSSHRHDGGGGLAALLFFDCRLRAYLPEGTVSPGFAGTEPGSNFRHVGFHQSRTRTLLKNSRRPKRTCPAVTGAFFRHGVSLSRSCSCSLQYMLNSCGRA